LGVACSHWRWDLSYSQVSYQSTEGLWQKAVTEGPIVQMFRTEEAQKVLKPKLFQPEEGAAAPPAAPPLPTSQGLPGWVMPVAVVGGLGLLVFLVME